MKVNGIKAKRLVKCLKCLHANLTITETFTGVTEHTRESNGFWTSNINPGDHNSRLDVVCHDCGMARTYWRGHMPNFLKVCVEELGI